MDTKNQVCSVDASKRLSELKVNRESYFAHFYHFFSGEWEVNIQTKNKIGIPAFSVAELIDILPAHIQDKGREPFDHFWLEIKKMHAEVDPIKIHYHAAYKCDTLIINEDRTLAKMVPDPLFEKVIYDKNLADCLAKMLIELIENKFITVENLGN